MPQTRHQWKVWVLLPVACGIYAKCEGIWAGFLFRSGRAGPMLAGALGEGG